MTVQEIADRLPCAICCGHERLSTPVTGGYAGDLLSDVIAHSASGNIWVTMQIHVNIVAVAVLKELAAIILVNGRRPAEDTIAKATQERIPILSTEAAAFETVGRLHAMGIGGSAGC